MYSINTPGKISIIIIWGIVLIDHFKFQDDRDCLTDMTLLMYSCKAGAGGVGDAETAAQVGQAQGGF